MAEAASARTVVNPLAAKQQQAQPAGDLVRAEFTKFCDYFRELVALDPEGSGDASRKVDILTAFVDLIQRSADAILTACNVDELMKLLRIFVADGHRGVRSAAYRAIRYTLVSASVVPLLGKYRIYMLLARSLDRDKKYASERMEALKLIRRVVELDCSQLPLLASSVIVSIAESPDDSFRTVCLETLCEMALRYPRTVALAGGIRTITNAVLEAQGSAIDSLTMTLLFLLNDSGPRQYIRRDLEIEVLLSPLTDEFVPSEPSLHARRAACQQAVVTMLHSWAGLLSLAADRNGLKSIVDALTLPSDELQARLWVRLMLALTTLYRAFGMSAPSDEGFEAAAEMEVGTEMTEELPPRTRTRIDLLTNYKALLLLAFVNVGLIEALVQIAKGSPNSLTSTLATALPTLVNPAGVFSQPASRSQAAKVVRTAPVGFFRVLEVEGLIFRRRRVQISFLHQHARWHNQADRIVDDIHLSLIVHGAKRWQRQKGVDRLRDRIDDLKRSIDLSMDDAQFQQLLRESQIPSTKDFQKWNFDVIREILEGPLRNPARLVESHKVKFCKRLVSFLRPNKNQFCNLPVHPENTKYVRTACLLMEVLLSCKEGQDWLNQCGFLPQIARILNIELEKVPASQKDRVLKPSAAREQLAREYFSIIGVLSSSPEGVELLHRHGIIKALYGVSGLPARDDLNRLLISTLDYNINGHAQILLGKLITGGSKNIRLHGTRHLRVLLRAGVKGFEDWALDMLVTQLQDADTQVVEEALAILVEACEDPTCLEVLISRRPALLSMGAASRPLMLRFLSSPQGLALLNEMSWVQPQMTLWKEKENAAYALAIETELYNAMSAARLMPTTYNPALLPLAARKMADPYVPFCIGG